MDCPRCKLVNPANAKRCDCGYDFQTHTIRQSYLTERDRRLFRPSAGAAGVVVTILFLLEAILRLTSVAVARHSLALGVFTIILIAGFVSYWCWDKKENPR